MKKEIEEREREGRERKKGKQTSKCNKWRSGKCIYKYIFWNIIVGQYGTSGRKKKKKN